MGETAAALATPVPYSFQGETYKVSWIDYDMIGFFEIWLEERAYAAIRRSSRYSTPAEVAEREKQVTRDVVAGEYAYGSETYGKSLGSQHGAKYMTFLRLRKLNPDVDEALVERMFREDFAGINLACERAGLAPELQAALLSMKAAAEAAKPTA